jgi:hypothetical protein
MRTYYNGIRYYQGRRTPQGCMVTVYLFEKGIGTARPLDLRFDLSNGGSGPAQLALALCADALDSDERAKNVYQEFNRRLIDRLPRGNWTRSEVWVQDAATAIERGWGFGLC